VTARPARKLVLCTHGNRSRLFPRNEKPQFSRDFPAGSRAAPVPFAGGASVVPSFRHFHLLGPARQPIINLGMSIPTAKTAASKKSTARKIGFPAVVVALAVVGYFGLKIMWGLMMLGYVDSAIVRMRVLNAAETQFAKDHPPLGYTCKLSELPSTAEIRRLLAKGSIDNG
jgi:hypothetical protein